MFGFLGTKGIKKLFSTRTLLKLAFVILREVLGRIYRDAEILVRQAAENLELAGGFAKFQWVTAQLTRKYATVREWRWIGSLAIELAVAEFKQYDDPTELLKLRL